MPTYEYRCKSCGEELEVQQRFTDDALSTCPACGEASLRKVFGNIAVSFKGSGFYKTDSRPSSGSSSTAGSSESKSETTSTSSETTSAPTTEKKSSESTPAAAAS